MRSPLAWMWLAFIALSACVWSLWGRDGFPVGAAWWDELALSGAAHAVQQGLVPGVDFWAPFILPIYLKALAQSLAGLCGGYVLECLLQGGLVLAFLTLLPGMHRRHDAWTYVIGGGAVLQGTLPFNLGSAVQAGLGSVVFAGAYNRLGGALITLVILAMSLRNQPQRERSLVVWLGVVLASTFLIKVTVFQVCATICIAHVLLCSVPTARWWWCKPLGFALVLLVLILWPTGMAAPLMGALRDLSAVRMSLWKERLGVSELMLSEHRLEMFVLVLCAALAVGRGILGRTPWVGLVSWYLLSGALIVLYMLTNFGDNGMFPALASVHALISSQRRLEAEKPSGPLIPVLRILKLLSAGLLTVGSVIYAGLWIQWVWALYGNTQSARLIHFPVYSDALAHHHMIDASAWAARPPLAVPGAPFAIRAAATYGAYAEGLDEALQFLAQKLPDKSKTVYALDFPSYAFALLGGYRVPTHSYPWLLYGHELSIDVHPKAAQLLSDVDVLMVSKCSLSLGNRRNLFAIYRVDIQRDWQPIAQLKCWDVWQRI